MKFQVNEDATENFYWFNTNTSKWQILRENVQGMGQQSDYTRLAFGGTCAIHIGMQLAFRNLRVCEFERKAKPLQLSPRERGSKLIPLSNMTADLTDQSISSVLKIEEGNAVLVSSRRNAVWTGNRRRNAPVVTVPEPKSQVYSAQVDIISPLATVNSVLGHSKGLFGRMQKIGSPSQGGDVMPFKFGLDDLGIRLGNMHVLSPEAHP